MALKPVELNQIQIEDAFWSKHVSLVKEAVLPYQWEAINDRVADAEPSHSLMNFNVLSITKEFHSGWSDIAEV